MSSPTDADGVLTPTDREAAYLTVLNSPQFAELKHRYRRWVIPATAAGLAFYFVYVLLSTYAVDLMSHRVVGNVNLGLILGLAQFVTTFAVTMAYVRYADRELDPRSSRIREQMEAEGLA